MEIESYIYKFKAPYVIAYTRKVRKTVTCRRMDGRRETPTDINYRHTEDRREKIPIIQVLKKLISYSLNVRSLCQDIITQRHSQCPFFFTSTLYYTLSFNIG